METLMQLPLQITFRNVPISEAVEADIREKAGWLEQFSGDIIHCHVIVELEGKHKHQGRLFTVRIDLTLPGTELAISHDHADEDIAVALRDAFNAAARQIEDYVRVRRGEVKGPKPSASGRVRP
jgi:ribosomal subunit interface protein